MSNSILIVEDEIKLASLLADYFKLTEYVPHLIHHGDEVIAWVKQHQPKAILLDIMLPGKNGIDLCKEIRQFSNVPILMVTAKVDEIDRLLGLELGADDYICKPFSPREVIARLKSVLRRSQSTLHETLQNESSSSTTGNNLSSKNGPSIVLDDSRFVVAINGNEAPLTAVEFQLFKLLLSAPERIFSRVKNDGYNVFRSPYCE